MSYSSCSGNFSSRSLRGCLPSSSSSCISSFPSNLVYRTDLSAPDSCQLGSSLHRVCQETCGEPTGCQSSCVVSSPCQSSCVVSSPCQSSCVVSSPFQRTYYSPRVSRFFSPSRATYAASLGFRSSACHPLGFGSRSSCSLGSGWRYSYSPFYTSGSCYPQGCGSSGFGSMGYRVYGFPSLSYGSRFFQQPYLASRMYQCCDYRPTCGSRFYEFTC
ncbi:keratin-associated protein 13-4-like [Thomomys bottae]